MTFFEPDSRDKKLFPWDPFKGVVVPRPASGGNAHGGG
jgi:hypothetical protein